MRDIMLGERIFLTGFMGCGKSTVGALAAPLLGWRFVDLDQEIEARAGCSVAAIFASGGEAAFRAREREALLATPVRTVCGLGGGALVDGANREWARKHGLVIYLQVDAEELCRRLEGSPVRRPLLESDRGQRQAGEQLLARISTLLEVREPRYAQAHCTIEATRISAEEAARAVVGAYRSRNDRR